MFKQIGIVEVVQEIDENWTKDPDTLKGFEVLILTLWLGSVLSRGRISPSLP